MSRRTKFVDLTTRRPGFVQPCACVCVCVHMYRHRQLEHVQECSRVSVLATATYKSHSDAHVGPSCLQSIPPAAVLTALLRAACSRPASLRGLCIWQSDVVRLVALIPGCRTPAQLTRTAFSRSWTRGRVLGPNVMSHCPCSGGVTESSPGAPSFSRMLLMLATQPVNHAVVRKCVPQVHSRGRGGGGCKCVHCTH